MAAMQDSNHVLLLILTNAIT